MTDGTLRLELDDGTLDAALDRLGRATDALGARAAGSGAAFDALGGRIDATAAGLDRLGSEGGEALEGLSRRAEGAARDMAASFDGMAGALANAFESGFARGASRLVSGGMADIARALDLDRGTAGLLGGFARGLFDGFRADGGPVTPGRAYVVGERGPEVFQPRDAGTIVPAGVAAAAPVAVSITVQAADAASFRHTERQIAARLRRLLTR